MKARVASTGGKKFLFNIRIFVPSVFGLGVNTSKENSQNSHSRDERDRLEEAKEVTFGILDRWIYVQRVICIIYVSYQIPFP